MCFIFINAVCRYISLNLGKGWIRFYTGEQDHAVGEDAHLLAEEILHTPNIDINPMKKPFIWKFAEYKLSPEDLEKLRAVKWPPSLVPPPTSPHQVGDGSPTDQLADCI